MAALILPINWPRLGWTPVILNDNGLVLREALQYAARGKRKQKSYTTLYRQALAISRMSDLWQVLGDDVGDQEILGCYFDALVHGDEELGWDGMNTTTAGRHLKYLNEFFDWWGLLTNRPSPNPMQEEHIGWISVLAEQKRQYGTNLLAHLLPATISGQGRRKSRTVQPDQDARRNAAAQGRPKAMDLPDYMKLIRDDEEPRNRALWLTLGATAGVRSNPPWLKELIKAHAEIYCGFDDDTAGEDMARAMVALHPVVKRL
ncbi:MAG: hypothetical protein P4N60_00525 [Verrucomicrobiae bacterium]|nr:hypothetical protein [Verrucomicrobiae bacterium]